MTNAEYTKNFLQSAFAGGVSVLKVPGEFVDSRFRLVYDYTESDRDLDRYSSSMRRLGNQFCQIDSDYTNESKN